MTGARRRVSNIGDISEVHYTLAGNAWVTTMLNIFLHRNLWLGLVALILFTAIPAVETAAQAVPVLGYVANENASPDRLATFKKGLTDLGYIEGKNIKIEYRYAKLDREYDALIADLVSRKVDIIV